MLEATAVSLALRRALAELAPLGGTERLQVDATADALIMLLADVVALAATPSTEVERIVDLFRGKLAIALATHAAGQSRRH
jgi:hypothetical protein